MGLVTNSEGLNKWLPKAINIVSLLLIISLFFIDDLKWDYLRVIPSILLIILTFVSLYYISNIWFEAILKPKYIPMLYLLLVLSNPYSILFVKFHIVALIIVWAIFFNIKYLVEEQNKISSLFIAVLLLASASLIIPQIFWLILLLFINDVWSVRIGMFRYLATSIGALITPALYYIPIKLLILKEVPSTILTDFTDAIFTFSLPKFTGFTYLFLLLIVGVLVLLSITTILKESKYLKYAHSIGFRRVAMYGVVFISFYFLYNFHTTLFQILIYVPLSILFIYYFSHYKNKPITKTLLLLLLSAIILLRVDFFI